jgi:hypothetical protein
LPLPVLFLGVTLGAPYTLPLFVFGTVLLFNCPVLLLGAVFTYGFFFPGATDVGLDEGFDPPYTPCPFVPGLVVLTLF